MFLVFWIELKLAKQHVKGNILLIQRLVPDLQWRWRTSNRAVGRTWKLVNMGQGLCLCFHRSSCEMSSFTVFATTCYIILIGECTASVLPPTLDSSNVQITLANATHTDTMCISMANPSDPFHICLVEVPTCGVPGELATRGFVDIVRKASHLWILTATYQYL